MNKTLKSFQYVNVMNPLEFLFLCNFKVLDTENNACFFIHQKKKKVLDTENKHHGFKVDSRIEANVLQQYFDV